MFNYITVRQTVAKRQPPETVYRVTYIGEQGKRTTKTVKATHVFAMEAGDNPVMMFENRGSTVFGLPAHSFIELEALEDKAPITRLK